MAKEEKRLHKDKSEDEDETSIDTGTGMEARFGIDMDSGDDIVFEDEEIAEDSGEIAHTGDPEESRLAGSVGGSTSSGPPEAKSRGESPTTGEEDVIADEGYEKEVSEGRGANEPGGPRNKGRR